jgi:hypothetical protein
MSASLSLFPFRSLISVLLLSANCRLTLRLLGNSIAMPESISVHNLSVSSMLWVVLCLSFFFWVILLCRKCLRVFLMVVVGVPVLLFLLLLVLLIRSYPFYSRIEFDKFMYKITFESLARKGGIMNGGRERRRFSFV